MKKHQVYEYKQRQVQSTSKFLLEEYTINVQVNDSQELIYTCTNTDVFELVVGNLFSRGLISCFEDIKSVEESEDNFYITLYDNLSNPFRNVALSKYKINTNDILEATKEFSRISDLHKLTNATHSAALYYKDKCIKFFDDIKRHNALDKLIGYILINKIQFENTFIFITGRIPLDMLHKIIKVNHNCIVTLAVPTYQSVQLAKKLDITIVGRARDDNFIIYSHAEKIIL